RLTQGTPLQGRDGQSQKSAGRDTEERGFHGFYPARIRPQELLFAKSGWPRRLASHRLEHGLLAAQGLPNCVPADRLTRHPPSAQVRKSIARPQVAFRRQGEPIEPVALRG